jgi:hypothetical protein
MELLKESNDQMTSASLEPNMEPPSTDENLVAFADEDNDVNKILQMRQRIRRLDDIDINSK